MAHDVFISYASEDKITADAVCARLESHRIRCWIAPRDVLPSMDYCQALVEAIKQSRLVVLVFSARSNDSAHVKREVERAVAKGIPILPFRIEDVTPSSSLEFFIADAHWLDALTPPLERHLERLAETVELLLSRAGTLPVVSQKPEGEGGAPETEREPKWQTGLEWSILWAEIALRDYEWVFSDHRTTQTLQRLVTDAREAIRRKDETNGRRLEAEIDKTLEDEFKGLMILLYAEMRCMNMYLGSGKRSQIRLLIEEICDAIRAREDVSKTSDKVEQLAELLKETRDIGPPTEPRERPTFLRPGGGVEPGREPEAGERRMLSRPPGRFEREAAPRLDSLHFTVTAPRVVQPKDRFVINVWAHLGRQRDSVMRQAREAAGGEILAQPKGPFEVARGTLLSVQVKIEGIMVEELEDTVLWSGEVANATFAATVPDRTRKGRRLGAATIRAGGLRIAQIPFVITVGRVSDPATVSEEGEPLRKAFASYASADLDEVLDRVQGMQKVAPQLEVFLDVLSLRSGEDWAKRLWKAIPEHDVFYLFWSISASQSGWVEKEWRCALKTRGLDFIDPVPLVSPELVPPPRELAKKHFNDWTLALKRGERQA